MDDLTFTELVRQTARATGQTVDATRETTLAILDAIGDALVSDRKVKLNSFGTCEAREFHYGANHLRRSGSRIRARFTATGRLRDSMGTGVFPGSRRLPPQRPASED